MYVVRVNLPVAKWGRVTNYVVSEGGGGITTARRRGKGKSRIVFKKGGLFISN